MDGETLERLALMDATKGPRDVAPIELFDYGSDDEEPKEVREDGGDGQGLAKACG